MLLYDVVADATFETNETGLEILQQLDGSRTCQHIAGQLAGRYAQPADLVLPDVYGFVRELELQGFVEWA